MKKSIYSLVLSDDIIEAIDQMAYREGTSRSNLINQILAEHLSMATPEMRFRDIFSSMEKMMTETFQVLTQTSDTMLQVRSPLRFRYKPTIRYQLELNRDASQAVGTLRISFRTTSRQLIDLLDHFFDLWIRLEQAFLVPVLGHGIRYQKEDGRLARELDYPANLPAYSGEDVGNAIAAYIRLVDDAIKLYFSLADRKEEDRTAAVAALFRNTLQKDHVVIL